MEKTPLWLALTYSGSAMVIVMIIIQLFVVPWQKRKVLRDLKIVPTSEKHENSLENGVKPMTVGVVGSLPTVDSIASLTNKEEKMEIVNYLFRFLQTLSAIFTSFSHGGNDVSNSIGPLIAIWKIYTEGSVLQKTEANIWLLFYGGIGMVAGMWILGRRVNETIGKKITKITPTK